MAFSEIHMLSTYNALRILNKRTNPALEIFLRRIG